MNMYDAWLHNYTSKLYTCLQKSMLIKINVKCTKVQKLATSCHGLHIIFIIHSTFIMYQCMLAVNYSMEVLYRI